MGYYYCSQFYAVAYIIAHTGAEATTVKLVKEYILFTYKKKCFRHLIFVCQKVILFISNKFTKQKLNSGLFKIES